MDIEFRSGINIQTHIALSHCLNINNRMDKIGRQGGNLDGLTQ